VYLIFGSFMVRNEPVEPDGKFDIFSGSLRTGMTANCDDVAKICDCGLPDKYDF
jgi:hypothetical protein